MTAAPSSPLIHGIRPYPSHRISAKGIVGIIAAHALVLGLLASLDVVPVPAPMATLMVEVIPAAPAPETKPPRSTPVERKPMPQPKPQPRQPVQPPTLAAQAPAATVAEVPIAKETSPAPVATPPPAPTLPVPAPIAPTVSQPRFDADYLSNPAPAYPPLSRRLGEEGKVVLRVFVEAAGRPSQIEIRTSSGFPRLDQAAQDAVGRWKFVPARRGDEPIGAWVLVPIVFNLKG